MFAPIPSVDLFQSKAVGHHILLLHAGPRYVIRNGRESHFGNVPVGQFQTFSRQEFLRHGLSVVLKSLNEFSQRKQYDDSPRSELDSMTSKAKRQFYADHRFILIAPSADGRLRLGPMRHKVIGKSGMGTPAGEHYALSDINSGEFMQILDEVFLLAE